MSTHIVVTTPESISQPAMHASFLGIMRGEFLKIVRLFWVLLSILTGLFLISFLLLWTSPGTQTDLQTTPLHFLSSMMESNLSAFRVLVGIVLLILTSFMVGREYQYGTIRILLARGAGRIQLLLAKLATLALMALALLVAFSLFTAILTCLFTIAMVGNLNALSALTPAFWSNTGICLLTVIMSMGATILLAIAMNALGRSLTFGLSASLAWFALDNMGTIVMGLLSRLTHSNFWLDATSYFLGPLLNRLPDMLLPKQVQTGFEAIGPGPLVSVESTHALWVIFGYALFFAIVALVPTWKRDVKE